METMPFLPAELVVVKPEVENLVASINEGLGTALHVEDTPYIWEFREMLEDFG